MRLRDLCTHAVRPVVLAGLTGLAVLHGAPAHAGTSTANMTVRATVEIDCEISATSMAFGTYTSGQSANLDVAGSITYRGCPGASLSATLDGGVSDDVQNRTMRSSGGQSLRYQLYRDSARTLVAGRGNSSLTANATTSGNGTLQVFGRVFSGQTAPAGNYTDTIEIVLTF